jgi:hypothetical protein
MMWRSDLRMTYARLTEGSFGGRNVRNRTANGRSAHDSTEFDRFADESVSLRAPTAAGSAD